MNRSSSNLLLVTILSLAVSSLACWGSGDTVAGGGGNTAGSGGAGAPPPVGQGGMNPGTCAIDSLTAQPWGANDDACVVQGDLVICSTYRFRFDGTWQKETLLSNASGVSGTCTQGSWSQASCGVLKLEDCAHSASQLTWSVRTAGGSATAKINGKTYSPEILDGIFDDCRPAACPDATKNTEALVGTWTVSENRVTVNCSSGLAKPTFGDFVWQKGTASDLEEPDGACTWQLGVLASTFSLSSKETCSPSPGVKMSYSRYDGELDTPTTDTLRIVGDLTVAASPTAAAGSCAMVGTLKLTKASGP